MKLIPVKQAQAKIANATANKNLQEISLCTFKKDRSVTLKRQATGWMLEEHGFENCLAPLPDAADGKRLIKAAFKREFPRSNKLYLTEITK